MVDPVTPNKGLAQPTRGSDVGTWDVPVNGNMGIIDNALGGVLSLALTNANITLNSTQYQNVIYVLSGALTGNVTITFPPVGSFYMIDNLTTGVGFSVTLRCGGGTTVAVPQGRRQIIHADGSNMAFANDGAIQTGTVLDFAGPSPPPGYLFLDGSAFSRTGFSGLYNVIGTVYGAGDGATTFNLPDARGRVIAAVDPTGSRLTSATMTPDGNTFGATGGAQNHVISTSESAPHNHGGNTGSESNLHEHSYTITNTVSGTVGAGSTAPAVLAATQTTALSQSENATHTHPINFDGGGAAHINVQPTILMQKIIKT